MKKSITAALLAMTLATNAQAGIAGWITWLAGECNEADTNGVQLCHDSDTGKAYWKKGRKIYQKYPAMLK